MILVDSNIPMYLVGSEHGLKEAARRVLEVAVSNGDRLVSDVEVLQEILHRYPAIRRLTAIQPAFDVLLQSPTRSSPAPRGLGAARDADGARPA